MLTKTESRFWILSLLIHGSLALVLIRFPVQNKPDLEFRTLEFQVEEKVPSKKVGLGKARAQAARGLGKTGSFFPKYNLNPAVTSTDAESYLTNPKEDNPNVDWGVGAGTFERISDYTFFAELYRQIDNSFSYPGVLSRNKVKGTINARIVLNQDGVCDWKRTKIQGHEPYLELYILDVLKKVCRQSFKKHLHGRELTNADLSFQFDINENNDRDRIEKQKFILGNTLFFYRNSHQSMTEWELGPFRGMFPIPAVYLNIPWIQENWERLTTGKDPLKEFKRQFGEG